MRGLRQFVRGHQRAQLLRGLDDLAEPDIEAPAVVLAPHPDDESLPCGGLIIEKRQRDVPVWIIFITDGGRSHPQMDREELRERRRCEGTAAAGVLGVEPRHITWFDFPDGRLNEQIDPCAQRLGDFLRGQPDVMQIILPYAHDVHEDHMATYHAAGAALLTINRPLVTLEYAIWFWEHWPWLKRGSLYPIPRRRYVKRSLLSPRRARRDFNRILRLDEESLLRKRRALEQHTSQMTALTDDWLTLRDVSDGEFVELFSTPYEIFRRRET